MGGLSKTIAVLPGDGIGPEVTQCAQKILKDCAAAFGHQFEFLEMPFGGNAINSCGRPLPAETLSVCREADAILMGAVGGPEWDSLPLGQRPESGLLGLRSEMQLYINLRPIRVREALVDISPLRAEKARGCNFEIVRELAGDIYFGGHETTNRDGMELARDVAEYSKGEIERVANYAFERASARKAHLTSVDKANVLATSVLWRKTVNKTATKYPRVVVDHMYVDNAAMQLVLNPSQFDVLLTSNLFGDILSDEAAALTGSIGLIPSMSWGNRYKAALYEPIHGSAPSLAGRDVASPLGAIYCASLMLRESFQLPAEAEWIDSSIDRVLEHGYRTPDIANAKSQIIGCMKMAECISAEMADSMLHVERYGWGV